MCGLYYCERPRGLRVASSLPALLAGGAVDTDLDAVALHHDFPVPALKNWDRQPRKHQAYGTDILIDCGYGPQRS